MKKALQYLNYLQEEIHSVAIASIDKEGHPVTCVIDIMLADEKGLYFLTAKGKSFYERIRQNENIALTGLKGKDTMSSQSINLKGRVHEIGSERLNEIFARNPYMAEIYPQEQSRSVLTVFQIDQGEGEFFDLSKRPVFRESFSFGGVQTETSGYVISSQCTGCRRCAEVCPQDCIDLSSMPAVIQQEHCLHCGRCMEACMFNAVEKRKIQ